MSSDVPAEAFPFEDVLEVCRHFLLAIANAELPASIRAKEAASDLVQDTLLAAYLARATFHGRTVADLRAWLRAILANELAKSHRRFAGTAARDVRREVPLSNAPQVTAGTVSTPAAELVHQEERGLLAAAVAKLPEDLRAVIALRIEDGLPFAAIGERLGRTEEAARKLFVRALN